MGSFLGFGFMIVVILLLALAVINRKALGTLWFNLRSSVGAGAKAVDARNSVNNMHQAVEDAKEEIHRHTSKPNKSQGQIDSLKRDSATANSEVSVLTSRVHARAYEVNGDTNDAVLLDLAQQLQDAQAKANDLTTELTSQTGLHNQVLEQVKDAVQRADNLEKEANRMGVKLDLSATRAELASVGLNFNKSSAHSSLSAAEDYKKQIQAQIDENNGAVTVAQQLSPATKNTATAAWVAQQDAKAVLAKMGIGKPADNEKN